MNYLEKGYELISRYLPLIFKRKEESFNTMPLDIIRNIFVYAKEDLASIASVSKKWQVIAYDPNFRDGILPTEHFLNNKVWEKLPGVVVEQEPHLPLCIYRDVGTKDFLALIHKSVKINGKEEKLTPKLLGELAAKQIKGPNQSGFFKHSWKKAINETQGSETMHWVWLKSDDIGKNETFSEQEDTAEEGGGRISAYFDTLVCLFLDRIKSESTKFNLDGRTWIRVKEQISTIHRIWIGNSYTTHPGELRSELYVLKPWESDRADKDVCILVARRSIGALDFGLRES